MAKTYYERTYNEAIEDVLVTLRSEIGMWESSSLYQRVKALKK
jgi:hypothetical protein